MMRIAIFSDVHGNWTALQEVWRAIQQGGGFDAIVCAGDLANGRPHPEETLQFLQEHHVDCVLGNGEAYLVDEDKPRADSVQRMPWLMEQLAWTKSRLSEQSKAFLRRLPLVRRYPGWGATGDLLVCHATPHSYWPVCAPNHSDEAWAAAMGPLDGQAVAFGHVHIPSERIIGGKLFVNVAHCGLGAAQYLGYTILTATPSGWRAKRRPVTHDPLPERAYALAINMPGAEKDSNF